MSTPRIAVVTGGNRGIGFAIVRGLCRRLGGVVYLTARDEKRGKAAVEQLKKEGLQPIFHKLDISLKESVEQFRDYIVSQHGGIDILVNNAALVFPYDARDSVAVRYLPAEVTLDVNYFSLVQTCDILFPVLRRGARVVNMSSSEGQLTNIPGDELKKEFLDARLESVDKLSALARRYMAVSRAGTHLQHGWGGSSYAVSKVCVCVLTEIQQRLLRDRDIKVNSVHPGYVDMSSHKCLLTVDQAAEAPLWLCLDAGDDVRGKFVWRDKTVWDWSSADLKDVYT